MMDGHASHVLCMPMRVPINACMHALRAQTWMQAHTCDACAYMHLSFYASFLIKQTWAWGGPKDAGMPEECIFCTRALSVTQVD
jgi:hypothetical protein